MVDECQGSRNFGGEFAAGGAGAPVDGGNAEIGAIAGIRQAPLGEHRFTGQARNRFDARTHERLVGHLAQILPPLLLRELGSDRGNGTAEKRITDTRIRALRGE